MVITSNVGPARTLDGRSCIRPPPHASRRHPRENEAARGERGRFHSAQSFGPTAYPESHAVARALLESRPETPKRLPRPQGRAQCEAPEADEAPEVSFGLRK